MNIYEHTIHWLTFIKTSPSKVFTLEFMIFLLFCSGPSSCFRTVRNAPRSQTTTLVSFLGNELQTSCRTRAAASNPNISFPAVMGLGTNLTEVTQQTLKKVRTNLGFVPAKKTQANPQQNGLLWSAIVCFSSFTQRSQKQLLAHPDLTNGMSFIQLVHHLGSWGSHGAKAQFASRRGGFLFHGCLHTETEGSIDESGSPLLHKEGLGMVKSPRISPDSEKQHL